MGRPRSGAGSLSMRTKQGHDFEVVVVAYRSRAQIEGLLSGLPADLPIVVVDNSDGSDGLRDVITALPSGRYLEGGGVGFARAATRGACTSAATNLVFVNPDTRPTLADIEALVDDVATDPSCTASAGVLLEPDGGIQIGVAGWEPSFRRVLVHSLGLHRRWPTAGVFARPTAGRPLDVDWVSGACMAVRRQTFVELGGFDPEFYVYNEDMAFGRASRERGLGQRLRTDVVISGDSGGSGAPSLEMMRLRGASMARYLLKHHRRAAALAIIACYGAGYAARAAAEVAHGRPRVARERWALAKGAFTGTAVVGGRVVVPQERPTAPEGT
jgi:N-acetylglucosaminyl-diphospho-decaprenol L-rhamnosyltransferase